MAETAITIVFTIVAGLWLGLAISDFKKQRYIRFGIDVAFVLCDTLYMIQSIFF